VLPRVDLSDPSGWPKLRGWEQLDSDRSPA
jgi:hypothetical protein